ncbi:hypothetical protein [Peptoniphilus harei]|uniref:Uncharacterized protein n=1 Tax=Peptoniphilus harei TaxID=54005 RepID=A0A943SRP6_9FIRM|nr:hypothetical protein [Peptoniphilus harei]MBS6535616.1 hypothetical protein [Peptoniphilus harei]
MKKLKIFDNKVKPNFKELNIDLDKYDGHVDPEEQMEKQDEFDYKMGIENANLLKTTFLSKKDKRNLKLFISVIASLVIMSFPVRRLFTDVESSELSKIEEEQAIPEYKDIAKVESFHNEGGEVYAVLESSKDIYRIAVDKDLQKKINVGDTVYLNIKESVIPTVNIERIVKK